jgi:hypothetical protein
MPLSTYRHRIVNRRVHRRVWQHPQANHLLKHETAQWMPHLSLVPIELFHDILQTDDLLMIDSINQTMQGIKEMIDHNRSDQATVKVCEPSC